MDPSVEELYYPFYRRRIPAFFLSFTFILFMVACSLAVVLGVIAYRLAVQAAIAKYPVWGKGEERELIRSVFHNGVAASLSVDSRCVHAL